MRTFITPAIVYFFIIRKVLLLFAYYLLLLPFYYFSAAPSGQVELRRVFAGAGVSTVNVVV